MSDQGPCLTHWLIKPEYQAITTFVFSMCINYTVRNEESHRKKGEKGRKEGWEGGKEGKNKGEIKEMKGNIIKEQKRKEKGKRDILIAALPLWRVRQL